MAEEDACKLNCNTDEDPLTSAVRELFFEDWVEEYPVQHGGYETAPDSGHAVVQYDNYSETVNAGTSSTETSATPVSSTSPIIEIPSDLQGGTSSASPATATWSREDNGLFVCDLYSYPSMNSSNMVTHTRSHTGERPFSCDLRPQTFAQREILVVHQSSHTGEQPYVCSICRATFKSATNLNSHMGIHNEERPYKCATYTDEGPLPSFRMAFGSGEGVEEWQVMQGGHETTPEGNPVAVQYNKDSCSETVNTTSSTEPSPTLMSSTAPITEIPSESQGGTSSASPATVTWSRVDNGLLVCHLCCYSTKTVQHQVRHSRTHTGERPFSCDLCPQSFKMGHHLECHRRTHTSEGPYVCTLCQGTFRRKNSLSRHMHFHNTEGP